MSKDKNHVVGEVVETPATPAPEPKPEPPTSRWITLTAYAPLQIVQAGNFLRYGEGGVQRYGPDATPERTNHPHRLTAHLTLKRAQGEPAFDDPEFVMRDSQLEKPFDLDGPTFWLGQKRSARFFTTWVWDFYRMHSGIRVQVEVPPEDANEEWRTFDTMLRSLRPGDKIVVGVKSLAGDILQVYPIDNPATEITEAPPHAD